MARSPVSGACVGVFAVLVELPVVPLGPRDPPVEPPVEPDVPPELEVFEAVVVVPELFEVPLVVLVEPPGFGASGLIWLNIEPPVSVPCTVVGALSDGGPAVGPVNETVVIGTGGGRTWMI